MLKKLPIGAYVICLSIIVAIAGLVTYSLNISNAGYFKGQRVNNFVPFIIIAIIAWIIAIVLGQINVADTAKKVLNVVSGLLQIISPALIAASLMNMVSSRASGLGYIFFSNADVSKEVQTPENLSSAYVAIACMIIVGVAIIFGMISAFFKTEKRA